MEVRSRPRPGAVRVRGPTRARGRVLLDRGPSRIERAVHGLASPAFWQCVLAKLAALHHLSRVVRYFQNHRVLNQENSPDLKPEISQLILELITSSFSEQNEIWGTLRSAYHPSALYKVKLIVFQDEDSHPLTTVQELIQNVVQATSS